MTLIYSGNSAEVDLENGAALTSLIIGNQELIKFPLKNGDFKKGYPSSFLFPFPNRIQDGKYHFEGKDYVLSINDVDSHNAIHGLVAFERFKGNQTAENKLTASYIYDGHLDAYPFRYELKIYFELTESELLLSTEIKNLGESNMPYGFGWHPYFGFKDTPVSQLSIIIPESSKIELNEKFIPSGEREHQAAVDISLKNTILDNVFALSEDFESSAVVLYDDIRKLTVSQKKGLDFFVIYTPSSRDCVAIEPQTCNTNAFNNKEGLKVLKPAEVVCFEFSVKLELLNA